jgi:glycosyltransferase involved in cell wall biosynthesis
MVLFLHNRYRTTGGEERVVDGLLSLVRDHLGEPAELLARDSAGLGKGRAAVGLLRGGVAPQDVAKAVRMTGARVVHAHNVHPQFGWRALAAARAEGARVVLHLHQYRLVCAIGVCFTEGEECTRCHGRNTLPGVIHNCRGSRGEALAYGAALALWQRRLAEQADAVIVPSVFARERLRELGAPLDFERVHVLPPPVRLANEGDGGGSVESLAEHGAVGTPNVGVAGAPAASASDRATSDAYALVVSRLSPEKGVDVAIDACRIAGVPLVVAGEGPQMDALRTRAREESPPSRTRPRTRASHAKTESPHPGRGAGEVRFVGRVDDAELDRLRKGAALAIVPSRSAETFGMAAAEAMAAGVPVVASRIGALPELVEEAGLAEPGDATALAEAIGRLWGDAATGDRARARVHELCAPEVVASGLEAVYEVA